MTQEIRVTSAAADHPHNAQQQQACPVACHFSPQATSYLIWTFDRHVVIKPVRSDSKPMTMGRQSFVLRNSKYCFQATAEDISTAVVGKKGNRVVVGFFFTQLQVVQFVSCFFQGLSRVKSNLTGRPDPTRQIPIDP